MNLGYDKALYLLPFDHRHSYVKGLFSFDPPLSAAQAARVSDSKQLICEGFVSAIEMGVSRAAGGIVVDEEFGADILRDARRRGFVTALSTEQSGAEEFQFEYGAEFARHIESFDPTFAKALVRNNVEGDEDLNQRQANRLKQLSDHCRRSRRRFMFELLVSATEAQLTRLDGDKDACSTMPGMARNDASCSTGWLRPADANEVVKAWRVVMQLTDWPASLVLSRQALPTLDRSKYASAGGVAQGAYVLADAAGGMPNVLLLATGSEVALCIGAHEQLAREGVRARVVNMPSWDLFESQSAAYRDSVLPPAVTARVSVEAASPLGWERHVGQRGTIIGMRSFGISAPGKVAEAHFGFDVAQIVAAAKEQLVWHAPLDSRGI